jgi:hypothetical protein
MARRFEFSAVLFLAYFATCLSAAGNAQKVMTLKGYVLDSACAFRNNLKKPISSDCARACAKGGSPLVILADDGMVYWPISNSTPATGQNEKLLPYAGKRVMASGQVFTRGGSRALVVGKIESQ